MFKDQVVIITGGSSGVGKILAERLVKKGATVALMARDKKKLANVKEKLISMASGNQKIEAYSCDVSDDKSVNATFKKITANIGGPDILINSAGILREGYFDNKPLATFREVMGINFFGTLHCIQSALPYFKEKKGGRIVNICSVAGLMGVFGYTAYCASKHAVTGLTHSLRAELKYQNITFHIVYPPEFDSPMVDEINTYRTEENRAIAKTLPKLTSETVADAIIKGIEQNRYEIIPGIATKVVTKFEKLLPSLGRVVADFQVKGAYKGPKQ